MTRSRTSDRANARATFPDRFSVSRNSIRSRVSSDLLRRCHAYQAAEKTPYRRLLFGSKFSELGFCPLCQRSGHTTDFVIGFIRERASLTVGPEIGERKLQQGEVPRFTADIAQDAICQAWLKFKPYQSCWGDDTFPQFFARQRTDVELRWSEAVAQVAIQSDDLAVEVRPQCEEQSRNELFLTHQQVPTQRDAGLAPA